MDLKFNINGGLYLSLLDVAVLKKDTVFIPHRPFLSTSAPEITGVLGPFA
jgi:hypothetical protein